MAAETFRQHALQEVLTARREQLENQERYAASLADKSARDAQMKRAFQTRGDIADIMEASGLLVAVGTFCSSVRGKIHGVTAEISVDREVTKDSTGQTRQTIIYKGNIGGSEVDSNSAQALWFRFGRPAKAIHDRAEALERMSRA